MAPFNPPWLPRHEPYSYPEQSPLSDRPGAFRLVKLLPPVPTLRGSTLRIQLVVAEGVDDLKYDALSYTWDVSGKDPPDRRVLVETPTGTRDLFIYRPLEVALAGVVTGRPLFVDQICINQADEEEKAEQVRLMRDIYARCVRLLVWLGPGTPDSDRYLDYLHAVNAEGVLQDITKDSQHFVHVYDAVMDSSVPVTGQLQRDRDAVLSLLSSHTAAFPLHGAKDVLSRSWFQRLWIIQEICLAPSAVLVCGSRTICFDCFQLGLLFFTISNTHWSRTTTRATPPTEIALRKDILELGDSPRRMVRERKAIHQQGSPHPLYDVVVRYNVNADRPKIGASLVEDRIFGVAGMAEVGSLQGLRVRYGDARGVFVEVAGLLARASLDVLLFSQGPKDVAGLPSWAPDWSVDLVVPRGYANVHEAFNAAGGKARRVPVVDLVTGCLSVWGVVVDVVSRMGQMQVAKDPESKPFDNVYFPSVPVLMAETEAFVAQSRVPEEQRKMASLYVTDFGISANWFSSRYDEGLEKLRHAMESARVWGQWLVDQEEGRRCPAARIIGVNGRLPWYWLPVSETDTLFHWAVNPISAIKTWTQAAALFLYDAVQLISVSTFHALLDIRHRLRQRFTGVRFHAVDRPDLIERIGMAPDLAGLRMMNEYADSLTRMVGQKLYLTETGYVGTGPCDMELGDVVVVLFGMTCPVVLRKNEHGTWVYVGEAYCYGVMNGEMLDADEVVFDIM